MEPDGAIPPSIEAPMEPFDPPMPPPSADDMAPPSIEPLMPPPPIPPRPDVVGPAATDAVMLPDWVPVATRALRRAGTAIRTSASFSG